MDFLKIDGGVLGAINFNNMIPVKADLFTEKDIEAETDENYKNLLKKQLTWCNTTTNKDNIIKNLPAGQLPRPNQLRSVFSP